MAFRYKLTLAYDGTNHTGWQIQPGERSLQEHYQKALTTFLRKKTFLTAASRTDGGVHALGQVAHMDTEEPLALSRFVYALNALLPDELRVLSAEKVEPSFHARYNAKGKIYRYYFSKGKGATPWENRYRFRWKEQGNLILIEKALPLFLGKKDFTSFANEARRGCASHNPIKELKKITLHEEGRGNFFFEFEGDGFLYKMVRNIVGTLFDLACGKFSLDAIPFIFAAKDRKKAGSSAPAHGLFLLKVFYDTFYESSIESALIEKKDSLKLRKIQNGEDEEDVPLPLAEAKRDR